LYRNLTAANICRYVSAETFSTCKTPRGLLLGVFRDDRECGGSGCPDRRGGAIEPNRALQTQALRDIIGQNACLALRRREIAHESLPPSVRIVRPLEACTGISRTNRHWRGVENLSAPLANT
jgi:hypothetical protein